MEEKLTLNLSYEGFEKYLIKIRDRGLQGTEKIYPGRQYIIRLDNNYGASVEKFLGSYGYEYDLIALGVIHFIDGSNEYRLTYDTPVTSDVKGYLTNDRILELLKQIKEL